MKKLVIATLLLGSTSLAHADFRFASGDGSAATELCIASTTTTSDAVLRKMAARLGIDHVNLRTIRCNGMPLEEFQAKYFSMELKPVVATAHYLLKKGDESPLTELCTAAAASAEEYQKVKEAHFKHEMDLESTVLCNGITLKSFARRFQDVGTSDLSQR